MTWLKLSDDFGEEAARSELSDAAFRTHVEGLLWTMRRVTGGWIFGHEVRRFAETLDPDAAVRELVDKGWWDLPSDGPDSRPGDLYLIVACMDDQPEPDLIEIRRRKTAERVRKHRRKLAGLSPDVTPGNAVTERVTRVGAGRGGTGSTKTEGQVLTPSQSRKIGEITTARLTVVPDDQQIPVNGSAGASHQTVTRARTCAGCGEPIPDGKHSDAIYCSARCKNAATKRRSRAAARTGAS